MPTKRVRGGAARPHRNIKSPRSSKKIRRHNFTSRNQRYNIEAQILALELKTNALRRLANKANMTARKIRKGNITSAAKNEIEKKHKENTNLAGMFSQMKLP